MIIPESPSPPPPPPEEPVVPLVTLSPEEIRFREINEFRQSLPIMQFKEEISTILMNETFLIVTGETGSGKST